MALTRETSTLVVQILDFDGEGMTWARIDRPPGEPVDIPVPADYLSDGRTYLAVFRASNNRWHFVSFER